MQKILSPALAAVLGFVIVFGFVLIRLSAQQPGHSHPMDMGDMSGEVGASQAMADEHLHMSSHMKMTARRTATPADEQRAQAIVTTLRTTLERYRDYHVALQDGYQIFLPDIKQPQYHFTNYWKGFEAAFRFDPAAPTSLLYKKTGDGYDLLGAMYTAPPRMTEDQLNERVPLGVAQWHAHVNICLPPTGQNRSADWTKFGFAGSISTAADCEKAGGRFQSQIFGWMVHVYPFETTPERIWRH